MYQEDDEYMKKAEEEPEEERNFKEICSWASKSIESHRHRAKKKGPKTLLKVPLEQVVELALNSPRCAICGIDLDYRPGKGHVCSNSPTIDRIDNGLVSVIGDMQIVCWDCNAMKNNKPFRLFLQKCQTIVNKAKRKGLL